MFEDFFIIPRNMLEEDYARLDLSFELFALDYCEDILDIPILFIEDTGYGENGLEVTLKNLDDISILREDWYIQLGRLASYARAS